MRKKNLIIFGTRPEAIKMAPLVREFRKYPNLFETRVCVTAQHRKMLDQVLSFFDITPDYDLDVMETDQDLYSLTATIIVNLKAVLEDYRPDYVYVHGDTTTTMAAGIASFYAKVSVCHIEAGLRTFDIQTPFPEEMNRCITGVVTTIHFSPTVLAKKNLIRENKDPETIIVTGNTVIDALFYGIEKINDKAYKDEEIKQLKEYIEDDKRVILVTGHRRENHGPGFIAICEALKQIAVENKDVQIIYPVHLNPNVQKPVYRLLSDVTNIALVNPLAYPAFIWLMNRSYLIITDSGGIQEEAPSLGKPVLVMREVTERPEAVASGTVLLVGTDKEKIISETNKLLRNNRAYRKMSKLRNPYGDGKACERIVNYIGKYNNKLWKESLV